MQLVQHTSPQNPKIQQIISLAHTLSGEQQQSALEYLSYLVWQNEQKAIIQKSTKAPIQKGRFDDVFGILTAKQGVTIEEMNDTIEECGSENYD